MVSAYTLMSDRPRLSLYWESGLKWIGFFFAATNKQSLPVLGEWIEIILPSSLLRFPTRLSLYWESGLKYTISSGKMKVKVSPCIGRVDWNNGKILTNEDKACLSLYWESGLKFTGEHKMRCWICLSLYWESGLKFFCGQYGSRLIRLSLYWESGLKYFLSRRLLNHQVTSLPVLGEWIEIREPIQWRRLV